MEEFRSLKLGCTLPELSAKAPQIGTLGVWVGFHLWLGQNPYVQVRVLVVLGSICIRLQIKGEKTTYRLVRWSSSMIRFCSKSLEIDFLFVFVLFVGHMRLTNEFRFWNWCETTRFEIDVWKMILSFFKDAIFWCIMLASGRWYPEVFCTDVFACESGTCFLSFGGMIAGRVLTERVCHWVLTHTGIRTRFLQDIQEIFVLC